MQTLKLSKRLPNVPLAVQTRSRKQRASSNARTTPGASSPLTPAPVSPVQAARQSAHHPPVPRRRSLSSDSSSSDITSLTRSLHRSTMSSFAPATVQQSDASKPPTLSEGTITAEALRRFDSAAKNYFSSKEIPIENQVRKILGAFREPRIQQWIDANRDRLEVLEFSAFMKDFRTEFLPGDWEEDTRRNLLSIGIGNVNEKDAFMKMARRIQYVNSLLEGTDSYLPDDKLRYQIEAGMDDFLAKRASKEVAKDLSLEKWLEKVKDLDETRRSEMERVLQALADSNRFNKRSYPNNDDADRLSKHPALADPSRQYNTPASATSSNSASGSNGDRRSRRSLPAPGPSSGHFVPLPRLTDTEKAVLDRHAGCYKCRRVYVYHRSRECRTGYPTAANYRPITEAEARAAAPANSAPAAAVVPSNPGTSGPTLMPVAAVLPSSVLGDGTDSDGSEEVSAPLKSKHLRWSCLVPGRNVDFPVPVSALIDNGCHLVLIRPELVDELGLTRLKLQKPEIVSVALDDSDRPSHTDDAAAYG